jgi:hypothetical protein
MHDRDIDGRGGVVTMRMIKHLLLPSVALHRRHQLPKRPGVYYAISLLQPFTPLYIGMSGNLNARWNSAQPHHKYYELRHKPFVRLWFKTTKTRIQAERLESYEIRRYKPPLNRRDEMPERWGWRYQLYLLAQKLQQVIVTAIGGVALLSLIYWITQK